MRGLCQCGCGVATAVASKSDRTKGHVRGEHLRFVQGHNVGAIQRSVPVVEDRGYETPCSIWPGSRNENGYGRAFGGQAHRVEWERAHGSIPSGMELDHLCRQRDCVRPDHLEVVTHAENTRRAAIARARQSSSPVAALRVQLGFSQRQLAEQLGVSPPLVSMWESGKQAVSEHHGRALRDLAEGFAAGPDVHQFSQPIGARR